jgi:hypothetical protein
VIDVEDASVSKTTWTSAEVIINQHLQGSSVTSEEARTDCITSINKVVHQLISRIICVVVVIEPTPIQSITYIQQPTPQGGELIPYDHWLVNHHITGRVVLVLASTVRVMMCLVLDNPASR